MTALAMPWALTAHFDDSPPVRTARALDSCHSPRARNPSTATQSVNRPRLLPARVCSAPDWSADLGLADNATCRAIQPISRCSTPLTAYPTRAPICRAGWPSTVFATLVTSRGGAIGHSFRRGKPTGAGRDIGGCRTLESAIAEEIRVVTNPPNGPIIPWRAQRRDDLTCCWFPRI